MCFLVAPSKRKAQTKDIYTDRHAWHGLVGWQASGLTTPAGLTMTCFSTFKAN